MRPVNLLPSTERPTAAVDVPKNASTAVVAGLALILLAVAAMVLTKNDIADKRSKIAQAEAEQAQATRQAAGLKAFGDFRQVKQVRVDTVKDLAAKRFDWERFMRELALVLPGDVWLTEAASTQAADGASTSSTTPDTSGATTSDGAVSIALTGCAKSQKSVAETMARLRNMHEADDVELNESTKPGKAQAAGPATSSSGGDSSQGDAGGCGDRYTFKATVKFASAASAKSTSRKVPSRLGGGA